MPTGDLYQGFLYAFAYWTERGLVLPTTLLLYPASGPSAQTRRLLVRDLERRAGAEVLACGIHIPTVLSCTLEGTQAEVGRRIRDEVTKRLQMGQAAA